MAVDYEEWEDDDYDKIVYTNEWIEAVNALFQQAVELGASDIHIRSGERPRFRINGVLVEAKGWDAFSPKEARNMVLGTMDSKSSAQFAHQQEQGLDEDYSFEIENVGRFRINAFTSRGGWGLVARKLSDAPKPLEELNVPSIVKKICEAQAGIIIVTGKTGSGKSTTLAGMLDYINQNKSCHILAIENPIEILHTNKQALVTQREIGSDIVDYKAALKYAMRQDPDVMLIGEIRDHEEIDAAITASDTGHLVLTTIHTTDTGSTIERILSQYPPEQHHAIRLNLATNLRAIISQRLLPTLNGGLNIACEILINTHEISAMIQDDNISGADLKEFLKTKDGSGDMQTFEYSLGQLVNNKEISYETALSASLDPEYLGEIVDPNKAPKITRAKAQEVTEEARKVMHFPSPRHSSVFGEDEAKQLVETIPQTEPKQNPQKLLEKANKSTFPEPKHNPKPRKRVDRLPKPKKHY